MRWLVIQQSCKEGAVRKTEEHVDNAVADTTRVEWVKPRLDVIQLKDAMTGATQNVNQDGSGSYS